MFLGSLLLVGAAAAAPVSWTDLLVLDCNGGLHIAGGTPVAMNLALPFLPFLAKQFQQQILARATCAGSVCSYTPSSQDLETFFVPSVPGLLNALSPAGSKARLPARCQTSQAPGDSLPAFASRFDDDSSISLLAGLFGYSGPMPTMTFPATCSYAAYQAGQGCNLTFAVPGGTGTSLLVSLDRCPASPLPFVSVTCSGDYCSSLGAPCSTPGSTAECGSLTSAIPLVCRELAPAGTDLMATILSALGLTSSAADLASCAAPPMSGSDALMLQVKTFLAGLFGRPAPAASAGQTLGFCTPTDTGLSSMLSALESTFTPVVSTPVTDPASLACLASNCSLHSVGNGRCNMECYNAACRWDGNDCGGAGRTAPPPQPVIDSSYASLYLLRTDFAAGTPVPATANFYEPCNGWGSSTFYTYPNYNTPQCTCSSGYSWPPPGMGGACGKNCMYCPAAAGQAPPGTPSRPALTGAAGAFAAWDGRLPGAATISAAAAAVAVAANSADRKSGAAFYTPAVGGTPPKGLPAAWEQLLAVNCMGDISLRAMNPNLGLAFSAPLLQTALHWATGFTASVYSCVANSRGVLGLTPPQLELRAAPWHMATWAYQLMALPTATLARLAGSQGAGLGSRSLSTLLLGLLLPVEPDGTPSDAALQASAFGTAFKLQPFNANCSFASMSALGALAGALPSRNCSASFTGLGALLAPAGGAPPATLHLQAAQDVCGGAVSADGATTLSTAAAASGLPSLGLFWEGPWSGMLRTPTPCAAKSDCVAAFGSGATCTALDAGLFGGTAGSLGPYLAPRMQDFFSIFTTGIASTSGVCGGAPAFMLSIKAALQSMGGGVYAPPTTPGPYPTPSMSFCTPDFGAIGSSAGGWWSSAFSPCTGAGCLKLGGSTPATLNHFAPLPVPLAAASAAVSPGAPATADLPPPPPPTGPGAGAAPPPPHTSSLVFTVPGAITASQLESMRAALLTNFTSRAAAGGYTVSGITFPSLVRNSDGSTTVTAAVALGGSSPSPAAKAALAQDTAAVSASVGSILGGAGVITAAAAASTAGGPPASASGGLAPGAVAAIAAVLGLLAVGAALCVWRRHRQGSGTGGAKLAGQRMQMPAQNMQQQQQQQQQNQYAVQAVPVLNPLARIPAGTFV